MAELITDLTQAETVIVLGIVLAILCMVDWWRRNWKGDKDGN